MKKTIIRALLYPMAASFLIATGCSKHGAQALAPEKIPAAMDKAFVKASSEPREIAQNVAAACLCQDSATAFADLEKLSQRTDLTPEQRATTAHAMATLFGKLRADSDNGNPAAQAVVHQYVSTR
jgi:thiamine pyrophosphate-dependent acetolactate synthase large subunit-like protein